VGFDLHQISLVTLCSRANHKDGGDDLMGLTLTNDQQKKSQIAKAGAEWANGDTAAAHVTSAITTTTFTNL